MRRTLLPLVLAIAAMAAGVLVFLAGHILPAAGLLFAGWAILGSLVVRGAAMTPGEGPPPGVGPGAGGPL